MSLRVADRPMVFALLQRIAMQQVVVHRREAGLVRPGLKNMALRQSVFQPMPRVLPQPREQHQIRAARHHMDSVDLQQLHLCDAFAQGQRCGSFGGGREQTLRGEVQRTRLRK